MKLSLWQKNEVGMESRMNGDIHVRFGERIPLLYYFLWVYAILRSIPNKLGGVAAIGLVFVSLLALPFLNTSQVRSSHFRPIFKKLFWLFVADCLILGWIGAQPVEQPYILVGQCATIYFFLYFLILIPLCGKLEHYLIQVRG